MSLGEPFHTRFWIAWSSSEGLPLYLNRTNRKHTVTPSPSLPSCRKPRSLCQTQSLRLALGSERTLQLQSMAAAPLCDFVLGDWERVTGSWGSSDRKKKFSRLTKTVGVWHAAVNAVDIPMQIGNDFAKTSYKLRTQTNSFDLFEVRCNNLLP